MEGPRGPRMRKKTLLQASGPEGFDETTTTSGPCPEQRWPTPPRLSSNTLKESVSQHRSIGSQFDTQSDKPDSKEIRDHSRLQQPRSIRLDCCCCCSPTLLLLDCPITPFCLSLCLHSSFPSETTALPPVETSTLSSQPGGLRMKTWDTTKKKGRKAISLSFDHIVGYLFQLNQDCACQIRDIPEILTSVSASLPVPARSAGSISMEVSACS